MIHDHHIVRQFKGDNTPSNAIVTLGGTGLNGAVQAWALKELGKDYLDQLKAFNILSGSVFSYILFLGLTEKQPINQEFFTHFDKLNRRFHRASFFGGAKHFLFKGGIKQGLFANNCLGDTLFNIFDRSFLSRTLAELPAHCHFYTYCHKYHKVFEMTPDSEFSDMNLTEILRACATVTPMHGYFHYKDYQLSDPMFTSLYPSLRKKLFSTQLPHLYINFIKEGKSRNMTFVKHHQLKHPKYIMLRDFIKFYLNIPNKSIDQAHRSVLEDYSGL